MKTVLILASSMLPQVQVYSEVKGLPPFKIGESFRMKAFDIDMIVTGRHLCEVNGLSVTCEVRKSFLEGLAKKLKLIKSNDGFKRYLHDPVEWKSAPETFTEVIGDEKLFKRGTRLN